MMLTISIVTQYLLILLLTKNGKNSFFSDHIIYNLHMLIYFKMQMSNYVEGWFNSTFSGFYIHTKAIYIMSSCV